MTYRAARIKNGLANARPVATGSGGIYACNDAPLLYIDDPATQSWHQYTSEPLSKPAAKGNYTLNGSTMSLQYYGDSIRALFLSTSSTSNTTALVPSGVLGTTSLWTVNLTATILTQYDVHFFDFGVGVANSSVIYGIAFSANYTSPSNFETYIHMEEITMGGTRVGSPIQEIGPVVYFPWYTWGTGPLHLRVLNDGVVLHYQVSNDGINWYDLGSQTTPTPAGGFTNYGFWMGSGESTSPTGGYTQALIYSNALTTPFNYPISTFSAASPTVISIGPHAIQVGDIVSITGTTGNSPSPPINTGISTNPALGEFNAGVLVTAVTSNTISTTINSANGGIGGTVILLSR
jgi:hypothetical protein